MEGVSTAPGGLTCQPRKVSPGMFLNAFYLVCACCEPPAWGRQSTGSAGAQAGLQSAWEVQPVLGLFDTFFPSAKLQSCVLEPQDRVKAESETSGQKQPFLLPSHSSGFQV